MNTPLTDAKQVGSKHYMLNELVVPADFARKLERDRAKLIELVRQITTGENYLQISEAMSQLEANK